jgi:hypothetical protein
MRGVLTRATIAGVLLVAGAAAARSRDEPIRLVWTEGDVAGMSTIYDPEGREPIGFIDYRQTRRGERLTSVRIARFRDGSSDEDSVEARVDGTLEALSGRSIIRDARGEAIVDVSIDIAGSRISGSWGPDGDRQTMDERVTLPKATYWGPLIFIVLKNFEANAEEGRVVFRTVAPTPKPMALYMELTRGDAATLERTGARLATHPFALAPSIHWTIDPVVRVFAPTATFWMLPGEPPSLARFAGPRNYTRQSILIQ